ncbi:MAG TPA: hypothetical protein VF472_17500 [Burkholderiaceae bacterium]
MNYARLAIMTLLAALLACCGKPLPQEKAAYVGEWQAKNMYLNIEAEGQVNYKRKDGNTSTSINAPIKEFHGDDFDVGVGPMSTTFRVSRAPYQEGGQWKMVVDGVELVKAQ